MGNSGVEDEIFIEKIGEINPYNAKIYIFDARTKITAVANRAKGGGSEKKSNYTNGKVLFGGIEGIVEMNSAYQKFDEKLNDSGWYNIIRKIIDFANKAAEVIHTKGQNVLVHGSDGWDRTSILGGLIQIFLDPYYRTIDGFQVLIEKDWVSFGHKFEDRSGLFKTHSENPKERAPVFISFCDGIHQIMNQFPHGFEFNTTLLLFLSHHVYTCKYGTFLFNNDKERDFMEVESKTISIWDFVNAHKEVFKNAFYEKLETRLVPDTSITSIKFWKEHFMMYSKVSHSYDHRDIMYASSLEEIVKLKLELSKLNPSTQN